MEQASVEKFEDIAPTKKKWVALAPQDEQLARTPKTFLPKEKGTEPLVQITRFCGGRESSGAIAASWQKRGKGSERKHGKKRATFTVKKGRF